MGQTIGDTRLLTRFTAGRRRVLIIWRIAYDGVERERRFVGNDIGLQSRQTRRPWRGAEVISRLIHGTGINVNRRHTDVRASLGQHQGHQTAAGAYVERR